MSDIEARHEQVLGGEPRMTPVERDAVIEEVRDATTRLRADLLGDTAPLPDDKIPAIMFAMQPYGKVWEKVMGMSMQLMGPEASLPHRIQKLAILRTGWLLQAPFEWGEHVKQARALGFTSEEIDRIASLGSASNEWTEIESAVLRLAEELRFDTMVSDETWAVLAKEFSAQQMFDMIVLVGQFTTVAYFQNAMKMPLEEGNPGLAAR